ncbi:MAG: hypothetical protein AAGH71_01870 [Planctomycetota bacterium]
MSVWAAWYLLHLPTLRTPPSIAAPLLLLVMAGVIAWLTGDRRGDGWRIGLLAGIVSAAVNLLLLGSKIAAPADAASGSGGASSVVPSAGLVTIGFLVSSAAIGAAAGWFGPRSPWAASRGSTHWLTLMCRTLLAALFPLIAIGGAVTSAGAGMAVPDWPGTYGSNMFLYPIGLMADPYIFLEHTHRLFGTLVGLTAVVTMLMVLASRGGWSSLLIALPIALTGVGLTIGYNAGSLKIAQPALIGMLTPICLAAVGFALFGAATLRSGVIASGVFALICLQGMLGALRVTEISPAFGAVHGVLAQLILACATVLAVVVGRGPSAQRGLPGETVASARSARVACVIAASCLLIQLVLAALFRHTGSAHALWTHIGFSIFAAIAVGIAAFILRSSEPYSNAGRAMRTLGAWLIGAVTLQMVLGFAAWAVVGDDYGPDRVVMYDELATAQGPNTARTLIATAHQANGALLLGLTAAAWAWARSAASRR